MSNYIVGSFNIEKLGDAKSFEKIAQIIKEERFDIVALQEARHKAGVAAIVQHLNPTYWAYSYPIESSEYAFI